MILKLILSAFYLGITIIVLVKWRKCGFAIAGNEIVFMVFPISPVLLLPGSVLVVAMRVLVCLLPFGYYVFWSRLIYKNRREVLPAFMIMWCVVVLFEVAVLVAGERGIWDGRWYLFLLYLIVPVGYLPLLLGRKDSRYSKNTLSLQKIGVAVLNSLPFFCISSGGGLLLLLCKGAANMAYVMIVVAGVMPLLYFLKNMPACMRYKEFEEMKKKAYILGRGIQDGQLLGEEHGLVNETLVEDVRIIYNLMTLFEKEKLYRNVDVKIHDVARMIGTNKSYLSRALNTRVSKNFCQFVNYYRIKEICTLFIENPKSDMRTLCEQCGFSSQSNFSIVFKYNTGYTPGDWCRMVKFKLENDEPIQIDDYLL